MRLQIKTVFTSEYQKSCYYNNILNILYGMDKTINFKDNNKYNIDYDNLVFTC